MTKEERKKKNYILDVYADTGSTININCQVIHLLKIPPLLHLWEKIKGQERFGRLIFYFHADDQPI